MGDSKGKNPYPKTTVKVSPEVLLEIINEKNRLLNAGGGIVSQGDLIHRAWRCYQQTQGDVPPAEQGTVSAVPKSEQGRSAASHSPRPLDGPIRDFPRLSPQDQGMVAALIARLSELTSAQAKSGSHKPRRPDAVADREVDQIDKAAKKDKPPASGMPGKHDAGTA